MKVVVIEDEIRIREGVQGLLAVLGEEFSCVGSAPNGKEGLALIYETQPDLIITDIRMPDMSGLEMLQELRNAGGETKAIVLSAYSEFDYARQAMKLGVTEYLLKPISVDEFSRAVHNMKTQIEKESQTQPDTMGTLEQFMGAILYGQLTLNEKTVAYMEKRYQIQPGDTLIEIAVYLGNEYEGSVKQTERQWRNFLAMDDRLGYCMIRANYEKVLLLVIYQFPDGHDLERKVQNWMLQSYREQCRAQSVGLTEAEGMGQLKERFELLYGYMDWNLVLGQDVLISYPKILQIQTTVCVYPIELENRLKTELCLGDMQKVENVVNAFHRYFAGQSVYAPKDVKECYVRFVWAFINITKEVDMLDYSNLNQQAILDRIMGAKTMEELKSTVDELLLLVQTGGKQGEDTAHLTVRRIKSMIHEFYQTGITLDEIAVKLNVTPEYLSTQFHKEMGETFTSYLKNYRVNKAKELLLSTSMKQYEVAAEVGYNDSKYFSRVFRESTGYTPAEYRKANK